MLKIALKFKPEEAIQIRRTINHSNASENEQIFHLFGLTEKKLPFQLNHH